MQSSKNNLKSPRWCQSLWVQTGSGMGSRVFTQPGSSRHFSDRPTTSGLPSETDIVRAGRHVSKV
jgi:hypothetical protein